MDIDGFWQVGQRARVAAGSHADRARKDGQPSAVAEALVAQLVHGAVTDPTASKIRGAIPEELAALENRLGRPLSPQLAALLRICRGATIGQGGLFGHRPDEPCLDIPTVRALYPEWQSTDWLPVAGDGCGNYYMLLADGSVGFVDTMSDPAVIDAVIAPDLFTFIETLLIDDQALEA